MLIQLRIFCFLLCAALFLLPGAARSQTDSAAPFIYYYSVERQAFIVERADGSASRILANYALPDTDPATYPMADNYEQIQGPGWSPSGRWFTWMNLPFGGQTYPAISAFVVSRTGGEAHPIFDTPESTRLIEKMVWAHDSDLLLIQYRNTLDDYSEEIAVYDPLSGLFLMRVRSADFVDYAAGYFYRAFWTPDDRYIMLFDRATVFIIPLSNGQPRLFQSGADGTDEGNFGYLPHSLADGRFAYLDAHKAQLRVETYEGGNQIALLLPNGIVRLTDWSPDEEYALIYIQPSEREFKYQLWLLSVEDQVITQVSPDVRFVNNLNRPFTESAWNADDWATFTSEDGALELLEASQRRISSVPIPLPGEVLQSTPIRWTPDGKVIFAWYVTALYGSQIHLYDPQADESKLIFPQDSTQAIAGIPFDPLSLRGDDLAYHAGIINLSSGAQTPITITWYGYPGSIEDVYWHRSEPWLLLAGPQIEFLNPINVVKMDGTMQRELALCRLDSASCFGWMPDER